MPAPAVYVLAIVGTVGAVIAFKEFVYEPHIAPAIDRWLEERGRRRAAARVRRMHGDSDTDDDDENVPMVERRGGGSKGHGHEDDDGFADARRWGHGSRSGSGSGSSSSILMKDGLLLRRPTTAESNVELDNLVAREFEEWKKSSLAPRRASHLDESIHSIPYVPLSPNRAQHVLGSASASPATPAVEKELPSVPPSPVLPPLPASPSPKLLPSPPASVVLSPKLKRSISEGQPRTGTGRSPLVPSPYHSPALPSPSSRPIPSLSQTYPQDHLDYEHNIELVSPPSSRADSPFETIARNEHNEGTGTMSRVSSVSGFSNISALSPRMMGLGNESFDTLSPLVVAQRELGSNAAAAAGGAGVAYPALTVSNLAAANAQASPLVHPTRGLVAQQHQHQLHQQPLSRQEELNAPGTPEPPQSMVSSTRSTMYHSFTSSDRDEEEDEDDVPLGLTRAATHRSGSGSPGGLGLSFSSQQHQLASPHIDTSTGALRTRPLAHLEAGELTPRSEVGSFASELSDLDLVSESESDVGSEVVVVDGASASPARPSPHVQAYPAQPIQRVDSPFMDSASEAGSEAGSAWSVTGSDIGAADEDGRQGQGQGVWLGRNGTVRRR